MILFDLTIYTSKLLNANFNSPKLLSNGNIVLIRNRIKLSCYAYAQRSRPLP
jgi:hypothetical protein